MATGISLHIGVNKCDPAHYDGWSGPLEGCEADADVVHGIARAAGFIPTVLKTASATRGAVTDGIIAAAESLSSGDIFLISYAGHGGQVSDVDGDEDDQIDETWCLYDGELIDDELGVLWSRFAAGVRVLILSDSCHSGTIAKSVTARRNAMGQRNSLFSQGPDTDEIARSMPREAARATERKNKEFYASIQRNLPNPRPEIQASIRLISGCQDDQSSYEKNGGGIFTGTLQRTWDGGAFNGNYSEFHVAILAQMKKKQQPNHMCLGAISAEYDREKPFSI